VKITGKVGADSSYAALDITGKITMQSGSIWLDGRRVMNGHTANQKIAKLAGGATLAQQAAKINEIITQLEYYGVIANS